MATSSEIEAALVERVEQVLTEMGFQHEEVEKCWTCRALIQALAELLADDEEDGLTPRKEEE